MKELCLEVFSDISEDGTCTAPLETVIALFTLDYCNTPPILLTFVISTRKKQQTDFRIKILNLIFEVIEERDLIGITKTCKLPVLVTHDGTTVVAGLCAVLRELVKTVDQTHPLLGFKQGCLYACAESSLWTKFCEVDIINSVNELWANGNLNDDSVEILKDAIRFEIHLSQPVKIHNIQKKKQELAQLNGCKTKFRLPDSRLNPLQELDHVYSEGPEMTLADVILFPCFHLIFKALGAEFFKQNIPVTYNWYETMKQDRKILRALKLFEKLKDNFEKEINLGCALPEVENQSLYKGEAKKHRPKRQFFTKQEDIVKCIELIEEMGMTVSISSLTFGHDVDFEWSSVSSDFHLDDSQVPECRLERKRQQLQNMTKAIIRIAEDGNQIVDFCSGSGHLGLILAHALPRCNIILLENKEQSLSRARERAAKLKLSNIFFCQSNVDYFNASFDIGVSLHACGVATDLVMERCIQQKAAFVCCPCCYGSMQPNHQISYPRSEAFKNSKLTLKEYFVMSHSSDQTHGEDNVKTVQGNKCMAIIDWDRCLRAQEEGYTVVLSKMNPPTCSPKNNILVGIPPLQS